MSCLRFRFRESPDECLASILGLGYGLLGFGLRTILSNGLSNRSIEV